MPYFVSCARISRRHLLLAGWLAAHLVSAQDATREQLLKEFSAKVCDCIDSINVDGRDSKENAAAAGGCVTKYATAYTLGLQLSGLEAMMSEQGKKKKHRKKEISVDINLDDNAVQAGYFELERSVMANCAAVKRKLSATDKTITNSMSANPDALKLYQKGNNELSAQHFEDAIDLYKQALAIDSVFAFAWDNLGLAYRKSAKYDDALRAYEKSLAINPDGTMPLQNTALVYEYKKEYAKAVEAYRKLARLDPENPEIYYGIGRNYGLYLNEPEKGLDNLCRAYKIYVAQKSPYRTDAENIISYIYQEMKKSGNQVTADEILKKYNLDPK